MRYCTCRDCMERVLGIPRLCVDCLEDGCDPAGCSECARVVPRSLPSVPQVPITLEAAILKITGGRSGEQVRLTLMVDGDGEEKWYATLLCFSFSDTEYRRVAQGSGPSLRSAVDVLAERVAS